MRRALGIAVVLTLVAAAPAHAETSFRGITGQKYAVTFPVSDEGRVGVILMSARIPCSGGRRFPLQEMDFQPPTKGGTIRRVVGTGRYRLAGRGGRIGIVRVRLDGRRRGPSANFAAQRWTGTLRIRMTVRRHGRREAPCTLRTRWEARAEGIGTGSWVFDRAGEQRRVDAPPGELIVRPLSVGIIVTANRPEGLYAEAMLSPRAGGMLREGHTYGADANQSIVLNNDPCSQSGGTFTAERLRLDRLGRIVELRLTYDRGCNTGPPERGTITWTATNP